METVVALRLIMSLLCECSLLMTFLTLLYLAIALDSLTKALFRLGALACARCPGTKMDVVQTCQFPELKMFINN